MSNLCSWFLETLLVGVCVYMIVSGLRVIRVLVICLCSSSTGSCSVRQCSLPHPCWTPCLICISVLNLLLCPPQNPFPVPLSQVQVSCTKCFVALGGCESCEIPHSVLSSLQFCNPALSSFSRFPSPCLLCVQSVVLPLISTHY